MIRKRDVLMCSEGVIRSFFICENRHLSNLKIEKECVIMSYEVPNKHEW